MIKLRSKGFCIGSFKLGCGGSNSSNNIKAASTVTSSPKEYGGISEIKWELRPGGMLVQKRESGDSVGEATITLRVSNVSKWHDISIEATSTFGELKMILSLVTCLEPREQRLLFKGKEREDNEYLHMVGVRDKDKVLLLQDPAIKEMKLHGLRGRSQPMETAYTTVSV
ncbi:BAG family molecular chaperone regulator 2-like [Mangifera indica]|uniref:BAG family molecular chaperone regulator 2-like n=1 Tax=Mangifera indica TaxID=29780 RepID=UPI001CFB316A|nr:BAG family molecular chaperone regulator 2-like [Mangifera indica]XP_044467181.1 BAG family molecular chaperone regulator 2-like [Mangifera indica]